MGPAGQRVRAAPSGQAEAPQRERRPRHGSRGGGGRMREKKRGKSPKSAGIAAAREAAGREARPGCPDVMGHLPPLQRDFCL